jgi:hypothetical protein
LGGSPSRQSLSEYQVRFPESGLKVLRFLEIEGFAFTSAAPEKRASNLKPPLGRLPLLGFFLRCLSTFYSALNPSFIIHRISTRTTNDDDELFDGV